MEPFTTMMIIGLVIFFILTVMTHKFEFSMISLVLGFANFITITKDTSIDQDLVVLLYGPLIAIILFTLVQFWRVKV